MRLCPIQTRGEYWLRKLGEASYDYFECDVVHCVRFEAH